MRNVFTDPMIGDVVQTHLDREKVIRLTKHKVITRPMVPFAGAWAELSAVTTYYKRKKWAALEGKAEVIHAAKEAQG